MKEFWSATIRDLSPYVPGEQPRNAQLIKLLSVSGFLYYIYNEVSPYFLHSYFLLPTYYLYYIYNEVSP